MVSSDVGVLMLANRVTLRPNQAGDDFVPQELFANIDMPCEISILFVREEFCR